MSMNLGITEMIFLFVLGLLLFGPKKLPEIGRKLGKAMAEFKRASNEFQAQLNDEVRKLEIEEPIEDLIPPPGATARGVSSPFALDSASGGHTGETPDAVAPTERQNG